MQTPSKSTNFNPAYKHRQHSSSPVQRNYNLRDQHNLNEDFESEHIILQMKNSKQDKSPLHQFYTQSRTWSGNKPLQLSQNKPDSLPSPDSKQDKSPLHQFYTQSRTWSGNKLLQLSQNKPDSLPSPDSKQDKSPLHQFYTQSRSWSPENPQSGFQSYAQDPFIQKIKIQNKDELNPLNTIKNYSINNNNYSSKNLNTPPSPKDNHNSFDSEAPFCNSPSSNQTTSQLPMRFYFSNQQQDPKQPPQNLSSTHTCLLSKRDKYESGNNNLNRFRNHHSVETPANTKDSIKNNHLELNDHSLSNTPDKHSRSTPNLSHPATNISRNLNATNAYFSSNNYMLFNESSTTFNSPPQDLTDLNIHLANLTQQKKKLEEKNSVLNKEIYLLQYKKNKAHENVIKMDNKLLKHNQIYTHHREKNTSIFSFILPPHLKRNKSMEAEINQLKSHSTLLKKTIEKHKEEDIEKSLTIEQNKERISSLELQINKTQKLINTFQNKPTLSALKKSQLRLEKAENKNRELKELIKTLEKQLATSPGFEEHVLQKMPYQDLHEDIHAHNCNLKRSSRKNKPNNLVKHFFDDINFFINSLSCDHALYPN